MRSSSKRWILRTGSVAAAGTVLLFGGVRAQNVDLALYRMKLDTATLLLGTVEVSRPLGRDLTCAYQVELKVVDQNRTTLLNDNWKEERGCAGAQSRTMVTYETLRLGLVPGRYEFAAAMFPVGKPGDAKRKSVTVESLPRNARASDLILAREVGVIDSTNNARWNIRHDGVGMISGSRVQIAAENPKLSFYLEVYPKTNEPLTGKVVGTVRDPEGRQIAKMDLAVINGTGPRSRVAGSAALGGLAPGEYMLDAHIELADTLLTRSARFTMNAPIFVAQPAGGALGYFGTLSAEELKLFDGLVVWMDAGNQRELYRSLPDDGRREFLARYFGPNGPTGDKDNRLDMYLERAKLVNEQFAERAGRSPIPPWQTDRGRVYMLRGAPGKQLKRPFQPDAPPYEIWSYDIGQQYVYLFVDQSRFGNYRLMFSTDPREATLPDWQNRVGLAAIEDLRTQFNIRTN